MSKVISYSIERIKPHKQHAIWLMVEPNCMQVACYLQRPKGWYTDAQWERILKAIRFEAPTDILEENKQDD